VPETYAALRPTLCVPYRPGESGIRRAFGRFTCTIAGSDFNSGAGGALEAVTVTWWKKEGDEFRAAMRERDRSKIGRMARLKGAVEKVEPRAMRLSAEALVQFGGLPIFQRPDGLKAVRWLGS
jgi:hypothetical protein